jgi:hypothetical protein
MNISRSTPSIKPHSRFYDGKDGETSGPGENVSGDDLVQPIIAIVDE